MHIIVKPHEERIDHPNRNPDYERAVARGMADYSSMKFENEAERRDYLRRIDSNPNNVPGLPEFYPPEKIRSVGGLGHPMPVMNCGHRAFKVKSQFEGGMIVSVLTCYEGHAEEIREESV
jgi:hypothetical protein